MEERLQYLIDRCLAGQASAADRQELARLLSQEEHTLLGKAAILRAYQDDPDRLELPAAARDALLEAIYQSAPLSAETSQAETSRTVGKIRTLGSQPPLRTRMWVLRRVAVAASVLLLLTMGIYLYQQRSGTPESPQMALADIGPGGNRALLTLADGRTIQLDQAHEGIVVDSNLRYTDGTALMDGPAAGQWMTMTTPRGGQYAVTLPDGSRVWLNAASSLRYPGAFGGGERTVELIGEAYFEIAHRKDQPFVVLTSGQRIEVLGTQFNVQAYTDEPATRTTLLQGRVKVSGLSDTQTHQSQVLVPGEQAILRDDQLSIEQVNVSEAVAWREARFDFTSKNLEQVMRELARWYDIEVAYEGPVPAIEFWGGMHRNQNLGAVLQLLETNALGYRLEGDRKLIITSKPK